MTDLVAGIEDQVTFAVDEARTIDFLGPDCRIYATPILLRDIEQACQDLLLRFIGEGQHSVGTRVTLDHQSATRLGEQVTLTVTVTEVDRRRVDFRFLLEDPGGVAAQGTHQRFIVDIEKLKAKIRAGR